MTTDPVEIEPAKIYSDGVVLQTLGITPDVLARERKAGRLRSVKAGPRRHLYRGAWLLDWLDLTASPAPEQEAAAAC